jgi:hypothetical protein
MSWYTSDWSDGVPVCTACNGTDLYSVSVRCSGCDRDTFCLDCVVLVTGPERHYLCPECAKSPSK